MRPSMIILCIFLAITSAHQSAAQSCTSETFSSNKVYTTCNTLPYLSATLHWSYHPSNGTIDIAYRAQQSPLGWVGWAINPTGTQMPGSNAFLAFQNSDSVVGVITTVLDSHAPTIKDENLTFAVYSRGAEYSGGAFTIYATLALPNNSTKQNVVWQSSTEFSNGLPDGHPGGENYMSARSLDFLSGESNSVGGQSKQHLKNVHGVLNALSWGTLMPIGVIIARYMRVFGAADPAWFYLHIICQCTAYILGITGWGIGLKLGNQSVGIVYHKHRYIGITLICLATLQLFALFLRPKKDHQYRFHWNLYHWFVGYLTIILSVINIFKGFDILIPAKKWKNAYIAIICALAVIALVLEVFTWIIVCQRKSKSKEIPNRHGINGANGRHGNKHQEVL